MTFLSLDVWCAAARAVRPTSAARSLSSAAVARTWAAREEREQLSTDVVGSRGAVVRCGSRNGSCRGRDCRVASVGNTEQSAPSPRSRKSIEGQRQNAACFGR
ncbi:hypothetical protein PYCCODRAFT_1257065 [Trametes coccinea BRFM310]|uniref:Uncharacterized protein n=1 Tax=Trametes coccinea (strain BRFM310) TaxID=1353009 RepID=A0A1Y2I6D5_TRAC3|nr:hypothetical protein PYCCODRAFT_1257065 [Trametes coccinea BRFM310]